MSKSQGVPAIVTLHQMPVDWGEGTSDAGGCASAREGDATWIHSFFDSKT